MAVLRYLAAGYHGEHRRRARDRGTHGVDLSLSVPAFALVAIGLIGHGLFVNGPVEEPADLAEEVERLN